MPTTLDDAIDYSLVYPGTPALGDYVEFDEPYDGFAGGVVVDLTDSVVGKLLAVRIAPGRTADTYWQRCKVATMPAGWSEQFAANTIKPAKPAKGGRR